MFAYAHTEHYLGWSIFLIRFSKATTTHKKLRPLRIKEKENSSLFLRMRQIWVGVQIQKEPGERTDRKLWKVRKAGAQSSPDGACPPRYLNHGLAETKIPTALLFPLCPFQSVCTWVLLLGCGREPLPLPQGLQACQVGQVAVTAHHGHLLALGDGPAAAAQPGLVTAHPVHLLACGFLLSVEEGLVYQELPPKGSPKKLQRLGGSWKECDP